MEKEIKIKIVDIWSTVYTTCLKGYLILLDNVVALLEHKQLLIHVTVVQSFIITPFLTGDYIITKEGDTNEKGDCRLY